MTKFARKSALLSALLMAIMPAAAAKLYKWVDENGNVYYSDQIPPDAARTRHQVLDDRGLIRENVRAAKTPEQIAEEQRQEEQRQEQEKATRAQAQRDRLLLDTFSTERDLILARDDRLATIQSMIDLTSKLLEQLREKFTQVDNEAQAMKAANKELPANLQAEHKRLQDDMLAHENALISRQEEKDNLVAQFEADLERFRELKALRE